MTNRICPACTNGRIKHYRSGYSPAAARCGVCKGAARVSAAAWLHTFFATPRAPMTRAAAIKLACDALGLRCDGTEDASYGGCEILRNGVGGLAADLRAQGYGDVADRLKAAYLARRTCETAEGFEAFVAEVEAARAELATRTAS